MTKAQIEAVLERVSSWPPERQEDAACVLLAMETEAASVYRLSAEERAGINRGLRDAAEGKFATDEEVEAVFAKHRRAR
jgi:hypothetical protein